MSDKHPGIAPLPSDHILTPQRIRTLFFEGREHDPKLFSYARLARLSGVSRGRAHTVLNGEVEPSAATLERLSKGIVRLINESS